MPLTLSVRRADPGAVETPLLIVALPPGATVGEDLTALDGALGGALGRTLSRKDFRGGRDESLHLGGGSRGPQRVLLIGTGKDTDRHAALRRAATLGGRLARKLGAPSVAWYSGNLDERGVEVVMAGLSAGSWEFAETKTAPPEDERRPALGEAVILVSDEKAGERGLRTGRAVASGYALAKRLGMMPGNLCTPDYLAETAREIGARHDMKVTVLGRAEMEREKMGSFLCVAQGTPQDPKLIAVEYRGGREGAAPVVLVGKGLCFDSGGISIKPAQGMEWMKFDMCGAAGVLGALEAIGGMKLPINVVGLIGATTNMPSGTAVKPGDVVQAMNGKFIEIINTDAEGRLVLADVLTYASRYKPAAVIDAATLTGACVIALGHTATGVFGADEGLVDEVLTAGRKAGEPGWPLPMWDDFKDLIKSDVADVKNSGGRPAGSITAAMFLREFIGDYPWVHLDIAGTAYSESDIVVLPKGPTGTPVGTFLEFVRGRAG
jgi:leucyl aminopeptidase